MSVALKLYVSKRGGTEFVSALVQMGGGRYHEHLADGSLSSIMRKAYWKNSKPAWRYMRLMEVVAPGSGGGGMVQKVAEAQYRKINELSRSEHSRHLTVFGKSPRML